MNETCATCKHASPAPAVFCIHCDQRENKEEIIRGDDWCARYKPLPSPTVDEEPMSQIKYCDTCKHQAVQGTCIKCMGKNQKYWEPRTAPSDNGDGK